MTEPVAVEQVALEVSAPIEVPAPVDAPADPPIPPAGPSVSTKDKLRSAKLPERTVDICLRGDLQAQWEDLHRALGEADAKKQRDQRLNSGGETKRIAEQIEALQEEMQEHTIVFRMRALTRRAWADLMKAHSPRDGEESDSYLGYNVDTFLPAAIKACTYEPADLDDADWTDLLDERITEQQFVSLQNTALALNVRKVDIPNSFAASRILHPSAPE